MKINEVKCPRCQKINELAEDDGFCEGPREYHAECWMPQAEINQAVAEATRIAKKVWQNRQALK